MMSSRLQMSIQCSNRCVRRAVIPDTPSTQISVMSSDQRHSVKAIYYLGFLRRSAAFLWPKQAMALIDRNDECNPDLSFVIGPSYAGNEQRPITHASNPHFST